MKSAIIFVLLAVFAQYSPAQSACGKTDWDCQITVASAQVRANPSDRNAYFDLGYALVKKGRNTEAMAAYDKYITFPNTNRQDLASAFKNRGLLQLKLRNYGGAVREFSKSLEFDPANDGVLRSRSDAYFELKEWDKALVDVNSAIAYRSDVSSYYYQRALIQYQRGEFDKAAADCGAAIRIDPAASNAYYVRALIYSEHKNDPAKAIADFTKFLSFPNNDRAFVQLAYRKRGIAFTDAGDPKAAVADLNKAIELDPKDATAYRCRAFAFRGLKMTAHAAADEKKAEELAKLNG